MSLTRTTFAPPRARTSLRPYLPRLEDITRDLAGARGAGVDSAALLVVASWRDEHADNHVGCWLRSAPPEGGPIAVALGAHLECDVGQVLGASLRHALLVQDEERRPGRVDVVDLCTPEGLRHDAEHGVRRVLAAGAVRFGAGTADVLAVPLAPGERVIDGCARARAAMELEVVPIACAFGDERAENLAARAERSACGPVPAPPRAWRSGVTLIGVARDDALRSACQVRVAMRDLEEGVLLGRNERCVGGGIDGRVSRVHAWVMARKDELLVADVGSTNGTAVHDGARCVALSRGRRAVVCQRGATILLAGLALRLVIEG